MKSGCEKRHMNSQKRIRPSEVKRADTKKCPSSAEGKSETHEHMGREMKGKKSQKEATKEKGKTNEAPEREGGRRRNPGNSREKRQMSPHRHTHKHRNGSEKRVGEIITHQRKRAFSKPQAYSRCGGMVVGYSVIERDR